METSRWEDSLDAQAEPAVAEVPSVVAVVVTSDPDERFDAVLASLAAQDYPSLTVLVVDVASRADLSARIGSVIPDAFIRRLDQPATYAAGANEALDAVEGANYLLFLSDDAALDVDAVSLMVEEAFRSNAGIVGPKFVEAERPDHLLQVGLSADKIGVTLGTVEPGEIDHEQHDAVRDVFAVPHAAMLIRADLCAELGGFDASLSSGLEEVDLCWRARLAGGRVIVAPDAVAQRPRAALEERFGPDPDAERALEPRHRLQLLLRNYSGWSLARILPQAAAVSVFQAAALLVAGRPRRSFALITAWFWNLAHLPETMRARTAVQGLRAIPDSGIRAFQVRGFAYARAFFAGQLDLGGRVERLSGAGRDFAQGLSGGVSRPNIVFGAVLTLLVLLGSRDLIGERVPAVGALLPWPGMSELFESFTSAWRFDGLGSSAPAPPGQAIVGVFTALFFGASAMARTAVVVGAVPLGAYAMFRLQLPLARSVWPPLAAAAAYAAVPLSRNTIAAGRLGPLVFFAVAPFLVSRVLRASRTPPYDAVGEDGPPPDRWRSVLSLAVLTALVSAFFPVAAVLVVVAALALLAASALAGDRVASGRGVAASLISLGIVIALLFPWSLSALLPTPDLAALGLAFEQRPSLIDVLRFDTGPARIGVAWLLLGVAALPLFVGSGSRLRWATRAWTLMFVGFVAAWLPGRIGADIGTPPVEGALVLAAIGISMAVGLSAGILREDLGRAELSWRQGTAVLAIGAIAVAVLPFLADTFDGRWRLDRRDWHGSLAWMESEQQEGAFRVLWVGDASTLPLHPLRLSDGTGWGVSRGGPGDLDALWPAPDHGPTGHVEGSLEAALAGRTDRLGHLLGPLAIRYIAYPLTAQPRGDQAPEPVETPLAAGLSRQVDLTELRIDPSLVLYENRAWMPDGALVTGAAAAELAEAGTPSDTLRVELEGARPVGGLPETPEIVVPDRQIDQVEGVLIDAEAFDDSWEATADGALRPHFRAFGLVNGFRVEDVDRVEVSHGGQALRYGAVGVEAAIWLLVLVTWSRRRRLERQAAHAHRMASLDVRPTQSTEESS